MFLHPEWPPSSDSMHSLLPAFEFTTMVTSSDLGAVFFANQKSLDRQVALKVFSPALAADPDFRKAFVSSSKIAACLRHTNLIGILDSGEVGGMPYLVMEFVPGKSLAHSTRGQVVEFNQSLSIINAICSGLAHANEAGLVHGHLDTLSILLNQHAIPKIGNFGLGRIVHTGSDAEVSRHFTAPEVLVDPATATKASDVFSIAAIFHNLISGQPYTSDSPPPSTLCGCRRSIDAVLKQATAPHPGKRYANAVAFQTALNQAAEAPHQIVAVAPGTSQVLLRAQKVSFDFKLLTKLILIVALLFSIFFTWKSLKKTRADRERENREILAKQSAPKEVADAFIAEQKAKEQARRKQIRPAPLVEIPRFELKKETSAQTLSRLRTPLAAGARSVMPVGSVTKGDRIYFFVEESLPWAEAAFFAEEHGAHLAEPGDNFAWLHAEVTKGRDCWLGAARDGAGAWVLANGKTWSPSTEPAGTGQFLISSSEGYSSYDGDQARPFVIEWQADGTNPGSLSNLLAATRASLSGASPFFPPGTIVSGKRRYLHIALPVTWEKATEMAESAGGHLLSAATVEEISELGKITKFLSAEDGLWLGGSLESDLWVWATSEPWNSAAWINNADATEEESALILRPGKGWDTLQRSANASGFLIEWSDDAKQPPPVETTLSPAKQSAELSDRVKQLLLAAAKKRDEDFSANVKKFRWDLDASSRGFTHGNQEKFGSSITFLKESVKEGRILVDAISKDWNAGKIIVSPEMSKLINYHNGKEVEIDAKFIEEISKIRDAYVTRLAALRDDATSAGQPRLTSDIGQIIDEAADLKDWAESQGVVLSEVIAQDLTEPDERLMGDGDDRKEEQEKLRERLREIFRENFNN